MSDSFSIKFHTGSLQLYKKIEFGTDILLRILINFFRIPFSHNTSGQLLLHIHRLISKA